jgi:hypothetical protein
MTVSRFSRAICRPPSGLVTEWEFIAPPLTVGSAQVQQQRDPLEDGELVAGAVPGELLRAAARAGGREPLGELLEQVELRVADIRSGLTSLGSRTSVFAEQEISPRRNTSNSRP